MPFTQEGLPAPLPELYALQAQLNAQVQVLSASAEGLEDPDELADIQLRLDALYVRIQAVHAQIEALLDSLPPTPPPAPPDEDPYAPGTEGEVKIIGGRLFRFTNGRWTPVTAEGPVAVPTPTPTPPPEPPPQGGLLAPLYRYLQEVWDGLTSTLGGEIQSSQFNVLTRLNPIASGVAGLWDILNPVAGSLYKRLDQALDDRLPDDLADVGPAVAGLRDQVVDLAKIDIPLAISGAQEGVAGLLGRGLDLFFRGSGDIIGTVLGSAATAFLEELEKSFPVFGGPLFKLIRDLPDLPPEIKPLFAEAASPTSQVGALFAQSATQAAIGGTVTGPINILLSPTERAMRRFALPSRLDVGSLIQAEFRDLQPPETRERAIGEQGWDFARFNVLREISRPRLNDGDLRTLVNRGAVPLADATLALTRLGYLLPDAQALMSLRRVLPGPSDIIRFAVREAFTPRIIQEFGLDDDFPELAVPLAERVGLAREDLLFNWRAHWELPSSTQGFEMFHRNVIDLATLNTLLQTQDVMPYWRPKLVDIAYSTLTRVDIRRFFRQRILTRADVVRRYLDIGSNPDDAELQADFVEAEDKDLAFNRALPEIRQQAKLGLLEGPALSDRITQFAPDPASAIEALELLELDIRGDRFGQLLSAYRQALHAGKLTQAGFSAQLAALGVSQALVDHYIQVEQVRTTEFESANDALAVKAAGRATVVRRFREGLTDDATFTQEMLSLGYSQAESDRYLDIAHLEFDTDYRLELLATALTAFRKAKLTRAELSAQLNTIGISPQLSDAYVAREIAKLKVEDPTADQVELRATGKGIVLNRYKEGWTSAPQFADEMASLGYSTVETQQHQLVADLSFDLDWKTDLLTLFRTQFHEGKIQGPTFLDQLARLGMDPDRAQTHLAREVARL